MMGFVANVAPSKQAWPSLAGEDLTRDERQVFVSCCCIRKREMAFGAAAGDGLLWSIWHLSRTIMCSDESICHAFDVALALNPAYDGVSSSTQWGNCTE